MKSIFENTCFILKALLIGVSGVLVCALLLASLFCIGLAGEGKVTTTTDPADYGIVTGNYDNDTPSAFMHSFFPAEISDEFSNVRYQYTAQKGDTYACQFWLEFDIENDTVFEQFTQEYTDPASTTVFPYDADYMDYTVSNDFQLTRSREENTAEYVHIGYAKIGKVLYNEADQHIIFYAMCMYDGGYSSTEYFGDFFTRFRIDPFEYEESARSRADLWREQQQKATG